MSHVYIAGKDETEDVLFTLQERQTEDDAWQAIDLSTATRVDLVIIPKKTGAAQTISTDDISAPQLAWTDRPNGKVTLTPDATLWESVGEYECYFIIVDGGTFRCPRYGNHRISVQ